MLFKNNSYGAFTLAEVLIVITLIGIIACMTIPLLNNSINNESYNAMFKKKYSEIIQVYKKITQEHGGYYQCTYTSSGPVTTECQKFYNDLMANYNVVKTCKGDDNTSLGTCLPADGILKEDGTEIGSYCYGFNLSGQKNSNVFILNDGTYIFVYPSGTGKWWPIFAIDVNGQKKPNQWDKDVFSFIIDGNKLGFYPCGSSGENILLNKN